MLKLRSLKLTSWVAAWLVVASVAIPQSVAQSVPPDAEAKKLAHEAMLAFAKATKCADFSGLHALCSKSFQQEWSPTRLKEVFAAFINPNGPLMRIENVTPEFDAAPAITGGVLLIQGRYLTAPQDVLFTVEFEQDAGAWRLVGVDVKTRLRRANDYRPVVPTKAERVKLIQDAIAVFAECVKTDDFSALMDYSSTVFQWEFTNESLKEIFSGFTKGKFDLSALKDMEPVIQQDVTENAPGILMLNGYFETDRRTTFRLRLVDEGGKWKILAIGVEVAGQ
jgi:hypothetical protein